VAISLNTSISQAPHDSGASSEGNKSYEQQIPYHIRRSVSKVINHASHAIYWHSDDLRQRLVEVSLIYRASSLNFQRTFTSVVDNFDTVLRIFTYRKWRTKYPTLLSPCHARILPPFTTNLLSKAMPLLRNFRRCG
jgi:hypothetical protein